MLPSSVIITGDGRWSSLDLYKSIPLKENQKMNSREGHLHLHLHWVRLHRIRLRMTSYYSTVGTRERGSILPTPTAEADRRSWATERKFLEPNLSIKSGKSLEIPTLAALSLGWAG